MLIKHRALAEVIEIIPSKYPPCSKYRIEKNPKQVAPSCAKKRIVLEAEVIISMPLKVRQGQQVSQQEVRRMVVPLKCLLFKFIKNSAWIPAFSFKKSVPQIVFASSDSRSCRLNSRSASYQWVTLAMCLHHLQVQFLAL